MAAVAQRDFLHDWLRLWNGRLDLIDEVVHPDFRAHVPDHPEYDRNTLRAIVGGLRAHFDVFSAKPDLGPIRQGDLVAGRWVAVAISAGESSHWVGQSIFRIQDERIIEHWEINVQLLGQPFELSAPAAQP